MFIYSLITFVSAVIFLTIATKITNHILQAIGILLGLLCLCFSVKFSLVPLEVTLVVAFLFITQKMRSLNRIK
jgi:nicotinamide riboside transporter PnuC